MATIGLIAGSFKPLTNGHYELIKLAARECDYVHLFVSVSNRARKGEVTVLGYDMLMLWKSVIEPSLPTNVDVIYGGSPIGNVWKELGDDNNAASGNSYTIYADPTDMTQNFSRELLTKYCGNLYDAGRIKLRAVERASTADISGTQMRQWLAAGDKESFIANLPPAIDRERVWDVLSATAQASPKVKATAGSVRKRPQATQAEVLLRQWVRLILS